MFTFFWMKGSCYPQIFTEAHGPLSPGVCSKSCPLSRWCYRVLCCPLLFLPSVFPSIRSFPMSQLFESGESKSIGASVSVLRMTIQSWFPLGLTGVISLQSKRPSRESSPAPQFRSISSSALSLFYGPSLPSVCDYWKKHRLDSITDSMGMNLSKLQEIVEDRGTWCATVHRVTESDPT